MNESVLTSGLYQAILDRRSIRRYDPREIDSASMARVQQIIEAVEPLVPENGFHVLHRPGMLVDKDFIRSMGAYGYIVSPPHVIAPYTTGKRLPLLDLGYRVERIVIGLTLLGLASCYIGTLGREPLVRARLNMPHGSRCGALLVFGHAATSLGGRAVNALIRSVPKGDARLPEDQMFFEGSFDNPCEAPEFLQPLITAGRSAPSAVNAQPWLFLWREEALHVFVKRRNPKYGRGRGRDYRYYDGGICMANISLAMKALGIHGRWELPDERSYVAPQHSESLQPLAALRLS
jgi:nitroreductase